MKAFDVNDLPPEFDRAAFFRAMDEPMKWATLEVSYEEISTECKSLVHNMKGYSAGSALPVLSGLLTLPEYQTHCIRLETLVGLAALHCKGKKKVSIGTAVRWFRQIGETQAVYGEDPAEDVFVSLVHDDEGNYRIFEGLWENAGFYTQTFSDIVATLPDKEPFTFLRNSFKALLRISDAICARAGLERYQLGSDERMSQMKPADMPKYSELTKRTTFTVSEFEEMGISAPEITPFLAPSNDLSEMLGQEPGDSLLEYRPLVQIGADEFVFVMPSAVSFCARNMVIDFMKDCQLEDSFDLALSKVYADLIHDTPLLGGMFHAPVRWQRAGDVRYAGIAQNFDVGFTFSALFFLPSVKTHRQGGFKTLFEDDGSIAGHLQKSLDNAVEQAQARNPEHKGGLALVVICGWGKGSTTEKIKFHHDGWLFESISLSDLIRISWLKDMSPEYFYRIQSGLLAAHQAGVEMFNINGVLNMIAWARQNDGHIIPHGLLIDEKVSEGRPNIFSIPQNILRDLRWESDVGRDLHRVEDHVGRWHVVQRVQTGVTESSDGSHKLYASIDDVVENKLSAVLEDDPRVWLTISAPDMDNRGHILHLWEMARLWLPRIITVLNMHNLLVLNCRPTQLRLVFEGDGNIESDEKIPSPNELMDMVSVAVTSESRAYDIVLQDGFMRGFRLPQNSAERAVVAGMLRAIFMHMDMDAPDVEVDDLVGEVVQNDQARSFHAIMGHTFLQYVADVLPRKLVPLNEVDDAIVKLGMGLSRGAVRSGRKVSGIEECTTFLRSVVDCLLKRLYAYLGQFNRKKALIRFYENIEKSYGEEDHWRRTSAALLGLHGDNPEGIGAYVKHSAKHAGASTTCRTLAEIGLCVCPEDTGASVSNIELSRMMALAALISQLGGLSDAIKYNALPPELHVSPYGDILFKDDFGRFVVQPVLSRAIERRFKSIAPWQEKNYAEPEIMPSIKGSFDPEFWETWLEEMGFDIDQGRVIVEQTENRGVKTQQAVYEIKRSDFIALTMEGGVPRGVVEAFLDRVTLATREKWDAVPKGYAMKEIYPWRMGRRLSVVTRPILQIDVGDDPGLIVAPHTLRLGLMYLVDGASSGSLGQDFFTTPRMRNDWWGKASEGHTHTQNVAKYLEGMGWRVQVEIKLPKILNAKLEEDYGDVDVLAWKDGHGDVFVIECKDLSLARNYTEAAHMLSEYQGVIKANGEPDKLKKHLMRFEILQNNQDKVASFCGVEKPCLRSALVCSGTVPMQFAKIEAMDGTYVGDIKSMLSEE